MSRAYDVVVIGGGLMGQALARGLAASGEDKPLSIGLVDAASQAPGFQPDSFDSRVVALSNASKNFLGDLGAWQKIHETRACPYYEMQVWDGDGTGQVSFSSDDVHQNQLGHIVENSLVTSTLANLVALSPGVDVFQGASVVKYSSFDERVGYSILTLDTGQKLQAKLIVGADGIHSFIRGEAGFKTRDWSYGHKAIVATVTTEKSHGNTAWQRFTSSGPIAMLPLNSPDDKNKCSLVWSVESDKAERLLQLRDSAFCEQLGKEFEHALGQVISVDKRFGIPLNQSHVTTYIKPGVALVGDAAHTIHPLAGLGANIGLADVQALIAQIDRAKRRELPLSEPSILRRYERERMGENLSVMLAMEGFKRLFGEDDLSVRFLRNTGLKIFDKAGPIKKAVIRWMCA